MALVISASRRERKIGQVRVFGFSSRMSAALSGNVPLAVFQFFDAMGEEDEIGFRRRRLLAAEVENAELEATRAHRGRSLHLFSKSYNRISRFDSATAAKKSLVVMSEAMPEGTSNPTRPCGATS